MDVTRTFGWVVTATVVIAAPTAGFLAFGPDVAQPAERRVVMAAAPVDEPAPAESDHQQHGTPSAPETPASATLQMQSLLGHHVTLAIRFMRATVTNDPGFVEAANAALVRHIDDIEQALEPLVGATGAAAFAQQWEQHTQSLFAYASAVRDDDEAGRQQARDSLDTGVDDLATTLSDITDGRLPREDARRELRSITDQLVRQTDAYTAEDYGRAYAVQRDVYATAIGTGQVLAEAAGGSTPGSVDYTARDLLGATLAQLLGEHVELAVDAMRAGVTGAPEFEAAAAALQGNTTDVADAMTAIFGRDAVADFNRLWGEHIDLFVDYTVARAQQDPQRRAEVERNFDQVIAQFGGALSAITEGTVERAAVRDALTQHEAELVQQIDVYATQDYAQAHTIAYGAYQHMRDVASVLADGFAEAVSGDFPAGGVDTGGGGTAARASGTR